MYVATNRFRVHSDAEASFEAMWLNRESLLHREPGFREFHMLKGPAVEAEGGTPAHRLYVSHTVWAGEGEFRAWTRSASFRAAHSQVGRGAADSRSLTLGPPRFEGFAAIQSVASDGSKSVAREFLADGVALDDPEAA